MIKYPTENDHFGHIYLAKINSWGRRGHHPGEDYNGPGGGNSDLGQKIYSFGKGKVVFIGERSRPGWGRIIIIEHYFFDENNTFRRVWGRYAHLKEIKCRVGQLVDQHDVVATMGNSGTRYAHLHFDVSKNIDILRNPYQYIWGWSRDRVRGFYADIHWIKLHWNYAKVEKKNEEIVIDSNNLVFSKEDFLEMYSYGDNTAYAEMLYKRYILGHFKPKG